MLREKVPKKASPACPHRSPTLRELRAPSPQHSGPAPSPRSVIRRNRAAGSLSLHPPCSPVTEDRWINGAEQTAPDPEI